ncbi:MAG: signal peptidase, partial [Pseudonocardiales bacterium]|nr:signal peptidase [Pseudonocardiales bacterium]
FWRELPMLIVVALLLTFLIQTFLARVYEIPSGSMETTLHGCTGCTNDRVLVDKLSYRFGDPAPGDVIVFRGPTSWEDGEQLAVPSSNALVRGLQSIGSLVGLAPPDEKDLIKRVIAVGGQTVTCCDAQNRITVDGKPLNEPYIYYLPEAGPPTQSDFGPIKVPDGQLWVMGDSRNNSADSRVPGHGPIPVANVIGKARFVVLPFSRIKSIDDTNPQRVALSAPSTAPAGAPLALGVIGAVPLTAGRRWWLRRRRRPRRRTGRDSAG